MNQLFSSIKEFFLKPQTINIVLIVGFATVIYVVTNKRHQDVMELVDRQWRLQDETFKKIIDAHEQERLRHEENLKKLQVTLDEVQRKYDEQTRILEVKKTQQVNRLVQQYDEDPFEMTKQLGETLGFTVVMPEKKK